MTPPIQWVHMIDTQVQLQSPLMFRTDDVSRMESRKAGTHGSSNGDPVPLADAAGDSATCRRLRVPDLRHLVSNYRLVHIDQPDSLIERGGPVGLALRGLRPFSKMGPITHLAVNDSDQFLAFAQFRQLEPDRRWVVRDVGLANGLFAPERVVESLLEYSVIRAGGKGVKRLFARVPADSPIRLAFERIGFETYMDEELYVLDRPLKATVNGVAAREQEQTDTWAVHQLYHAAVPRQVQFAEAWTSHQWDTANPKRKADCWRSFVLEEGHQIVAFARVRIGGKVAAIDIMYLPDCRQDLASFCGGVIETALRDGHAERIFVPVRAYQAELTSILDRVGFVHVRSQELLIKYTVAKVAAKSSESIILAPAEVLERVPKRVPTFLNRPARQKASP